ncbi:MAG TPA: hypothetical protein VII58_05545 [Acidobacteriaceae bacterium]
MPENEKNRFPQIPRTVWWGVRAILNRTPGAVFDERFLAIQLNVQEAAARQYVAELTSVGILNDEKKATSLALEWRLDSSYHGAVEKLVRKVYPQALLDLAPHEEGDRQKATSFFMREGLGQGAAGNKAATYFLIGSKDPNESPVRTVPKPKANADGSVTMPERPVGQRRPSVPSGKEQGRGRQGNAPTDSIPLNVNVQIHIGADAGTEQIEAIFSAMKRYLDDTQVR